MQLVLQQTPSGAHVVPAIHPPVVAVQLWPRLLLQAPEASQVPAHESASAALMTFAQLPVEAAQAWQVPQVAVMQHTPSTQWPLAHVASWPAEQMDPLVLSVRHALVVASQYWPVAQGEVVLQPPEHCMPSAAQRLEAQAVPVTVVHDPVPSQVDGTFAMPAEQVAGAHCLSALG